MQVAFAPVYTAKTWRELSTKMRSARGKKPPLTNSEAVALIDEWRLVARVDPAPVWYQLAAHAYGWDPPRVVAMANTSKQAARSYMLPAALWGWVDTVAADLDEHRGAGDPPPRISIDRDKFASPTFYGDVRARLAEDGVLDVQAKVPLPTCRDTKTGKLRFPRPGDTSKTCTPTIVDDPLTAAANSFWSLAFMVGALWLLARDTRR